MKNSKVQIALSAISLFSILLMTINVKAGSIGLNEVVQVVNSNPQNTSKNGVTELRVSQQDQENPPQLKTPVASTTTATTESATPQQQDGNNFPPSPQTRVQDESGEIVEITEEQCECADLVPPRVIEDAARRRGFPYYLLGIAAVPLIFLTTRNGDDPPPPTFDPTPTTPTTTPTTPTMSPSVPDTTPTPEPLSILLFGTGLAGLGAAARRRFKGKKNEGNVKA